MAFSQLQPILKEMGLRSSFNVILRMYAIMCANIMEKSRNWRVQMKIQGYKEHRGETGADVLTFCILKSFATAWLHIHIYWCVETHYCIESHTLTITSPVVVIRYITSSSWRWRIRKVDPTFTTFIHLLGKFISCPNWQRFILWGAGMYSIQSYWYVIWTIREFALIIVLVKMSQSWNYSNS